MKKKRLLTIGIIAIVIIAVVLLVLRIFGSGGRAIDNEAEASITGDLSIRGSIVSSSEQDVRDWVKKTRRQQGNITEFV